jgi:hypothetical protein
MFLNVRRTRIFGFTKHSILGRIFELRNLSSLVESLKYFADSEKKLQSTEVELAKSFTWLRSAELHVETYLGLLK